MGRLVSAPYAHISAVLDKLDELGVTSEDLDRFRSGHNHETVDKVARLLRFHDPRCHKIIRGAAAPWQQGNHLRLVSHTAHADFKLGDVVEFHGLELYWSDPERPLDYEEFLEGIASKRVLNANAVDYLLANPTFIPYEWNKQNGEHESLVYVFPGTVYRTYGRLAVRGITRRRGVWSEHVVDLPPTRHIPGNSKRPFLVPIVLGKEEHFLQ